MLIKYPFKIDSTDHCFTRKQEKRGNGNCLANFIGHAIIFRLRIFFRVDPESILYFAGETRVKERDRVE